MRSSNLSNSESVSWSATYGSVGYNKQQDYGEDGQGGTVSLNSQAPKSWKEIDGTSQQPQTCKERLLSPVVLRAANLGLMVLAIMGYGMCVSLFAPFFPTEAEQRGVSTTVVGLIFASYTFVMFIGTPLTGYLIKNLGLQFMIGAGMFLAGGATILFGFLDTAPPGISYVILCFAVRVVEGAGASMYMTASYSISAALYSNQISFAYALLETGNSLGRIVGPSAGGGLFNLGGFSLPFFVVGALLLIFGAFSMLLLKVTSYYVPVLDDLMKDKPDDNTNRQTKKLPWSHYFRVSIHAWVLSTSQAVSAFLFTFPEPTLSLQLASLGFTDAASVGFVFLAGSLAYSIVCLIVGKVADRLTKYIYYIMAFGALLVAVSFFIIGPSPMFQGAFKASVGLTIAGNTMLYVGVAFLLSPVPQALLSSVRAAGYPDGIETSSFIASLYNGMWFAGGCFGPAVSGALMDAFGYAIASTVMGGVALFLFVVLITGDILDRFGVCGKTSKRNFKYETFPESSRSVSMARPKW